MTLARKGARAIMVAGICYRWTVAPNDEPGMAIVVEAASVPGQRLVAWVAHGTIITPRLVQAVIGWALQRDWQPQRRGPTRILHLEPAMLADGHRIFPLRAGIRRPMDEEDL